jgi:hypothetical protein
MTGVMKLALAVAVLMTAPSVLYADVLDLRPVGAGPLSATPAIIVGGGQFTVIEISTQPAGTGVIDPFVRIQANNQEMGYNTTADNPHDNPMDTKPPEGYNRALRFSEVPLVGGFRVFLLDINESAGGDDEWLVITQIQIFLSSPADAPLDLTAPGAVPTLGFPGASEIFRMTTNGGITNTILLSFNIGSGGADMLLKIPDAAFGAAGPDTFVTLFSSFGFTGANNPLQSSDGFEEWAVLKTSSVPEPTSLVLLGIGIVGLAAERVRRSRL